MLQLGGPALQYLTDLTYSRPRLWLRDVESLHELLAQHGAERLRAAFEQGLTEELFGAVYVAHALHTRLPAGPQRELAL